MSDLKTQIKHSNICDIALKRIRKYCGKKTKDITEEEKQKYKAFFEGETGIFIIEKLARDITERCKLPEAIEFKNSRKNKKNTFLTKILCLIKNLITGNQIFGLKIIILLLKLMKEIMKIMTQMVQKKKKIRLKRIVLKFFDIIPMILILIFINF